MRIFLITFLFLWSASAGSSSLDFIPDEFGMIAMSQGIEPPVLRSLCQIESNLKHSTYWKITRSTSGALGICQLKPATARWFGCGNIQNRFWNIQCSAKYL